MYFLSSLLHVDPQDDCFNKPNEKGLISTALVTVTQTVLPVWWKARVGNISVLEDSLSRMHSEEDSHRNTPKPIEVKFPLAQSADALEKLNLSPLNLWRRENFLF